MKKLRKFIALLLVKLACKIEPKEAQEWMTGDYEITSFKIRIPK